MTKEGKPHTWTRVSQGTKSNEDISTRYTQQRGSELKRLSLTVSGSAESAQHVHDLKVMSKRRRDGLLQDACLTGSSLVSGLAFDMVFIKKIACMVERVRDLPPIRTLHACRNGGRITFPFNFWKSVDVR